MDEVELRIQARLAWNNWPDTPRTREQIMERERVDRQSAEAWDRVIYAILKELEFCSSARDT